MYLSYEPNPFDINSGGLVLSSTNSFYDFSISLTSRWRVQGVVEKDLYTTWNTGEGDYYWYRIDGTCGELKCDENGILYPDCKNMKFFTVIAARSVGEVCDLLSSPTYSPPVNLKLASIGKYSRPLLKENIVDECNVIQEQEFCQVAECLDYCLDEDVVVSASFKTIPIEAVYNHEMNGGFSLKGKAELLGYKEYAPESDFSTASLSGSATDLFVRLFYPTYLTLGFSSGFLDLKSSKYSYNSDMGISLGGFSQNISPNKSYRSIVDLNLHGDTKITRVFYGSGSINFTSDHAYALRHRYDSAGGLNLSGILQDCVSPRYTYESKGSLGLGGAASTNFSNLGVISSFYSFVLSSFDFDSELREIEYGSNLTIDDATVTPPCGCGPLGMSILMTHNLSNSQVLSNFFRRNGLDFGNSTYLRFKTEDYSWRSTQHFTGRSRDGVAFEDVTIFHILQCLVSLDVWKFSLIVKSFNQTTKKELQTKLIIDIPANLICSDNNISTIIRTFVGVGVSEITTAQNTFAVSPPRQFPTRYRETTTIVDNNLNDHSVYYDNLGLFKDSYWLDSPIEFNISPISRVEMPTVDLQSIF